MAQAGERVRPVADPAVTEVGLALFRGASMDIHKPRAAHSVREFLIEIGTIICGILIALGLEQVVLRGEWAHRVKAAEDAMRHELLWDDGPQIYQRVAMHDCLTGRLDA